MLGEILAILGLVSEALSGLYGGKATNLTALAIRLAQAANRMHIAQEGKPIDPSLLAPEQPVT
jgi:hypothetical protein